MTKVLIVGPPRSGTTWIGQALGRSEGTRYVHEPDGDHEPYAFKAKRGYGGQAALQPGDEARYYEKLWQGAFAGGRRSRSPRARLARRLLGAVRTKDRNPALRGHDLTPNMRAAIALAVPMRPEPTENVVVKSVHASLAVEWIDRRFAPRVVVVERHPLNVLSSWKQYSHGASPWMQAELAAYAARVWNVDLPIEGRSRFALQAMSLGVLVGALREAASRNPDWVVVRHEILCVDPQARFRELTKSLGLEFSESTANYLRDSDQPGEGYVTKRVTKTLPSKWRRELTEDELAEAVKVFDAFPVSLGLSAAMHDREPL